MASLYGRKINIELIKKISLNIQIPLWKKVKNNWLRLQELEEINNEKYSYN